MHAGVHAFPLSVPLSLSRCHSCRCCSYTRSHTDSHTSTKEPNVSHLNFKNSGATANCLVNLQKPKHQASAWFTEKWMHCSLQQKRAEILAFMEGCNWFNTQRRQKRTNLKTVLDVWAVSHQTKNNTLLIWLWLSYLEMLSQTLNWASCTYSNHLLQEVNPFILA